MGYTMLHTGEVSSAKFVYSFVSTYLLELIGLIVQSLYLQLVIMAFQYLQLPSILNAACKQTHLLEISKVLVDMVWNYGTQSNRGQ